MKKFKHAIALTLILASTLLLSACTGQWTYVSPTVNVDEITVSSWEKAINLAAMSAVSIYVQGATREGEAVGLGAGIIYSLDKENGNAYIVTNYHVVYDDDFVLNSHIASSIKAEIYGSEGTYFVSTGSGTDVVWGDQMISCTYVGGSMEYDVAVLKVTGSEILKNSDCRAATIASEPAHLGQTIFAIGNPLGEHLSATSGIVSVESEYIQYSDFHDVIVRCLRTDAAINGGNSGGGVFDEKGRLIGIANAGVDDAENIGSALPIQNVQNVADNIIFGYENNAYSGLKKYDIGLEVAGKDSRAVFDEQLGIAIIKEKVVVSEVSGKALSAGLKVGDIITSMQIGEEKLTLDREFELEDFLLKLRPNGSVTFTTTSALGQKDFTINV